MQATTKSNDLLLCEKITLNTNELMQVLSCGRSTAIEIGTAAKARVTCGKRVLWNSNKLKIYLDSIASE